MRPSIVVVGSSNTDLVARAPRIPVPGETLLGDDFSMYPGGKGANQAVACARLGAQVCFVANVGLDAFGDEAVLGLEAEGIDVSHIRRDEDFASGVAMIVVGDNAENSIVVVPGSNEQLLPEDLERAGGAIASADVLLVQLEVPVETVLHALKLAKKASTMTILNPAPAMELPDETYELVDWLTPNRVEAELLSGMEITDRDSAARVGERLLEKGAKGVIVTLSDDGALVVTPSHELHAHSPVVVSPVDTTAAGDAFNGALACALARGDGIGDAVRFACAVGAMSVTRLGAQPSMPRLDEVEEFITS